MLRQSDIAEKPRQNWVSAWYAAPQEMPSASLEGRTLRQIAFLHAEGEQIRVHLSNRYGHGSVTLSSMSVGIVIQGPIVRESRPLRFAGKATLTLSPGQEVEFTNLAVTFVTQGDCTTGHLTAQQTSYVSGRSDVSCCPSEFSWLAYPVQTSSYWLLSGVDVLPREPIKAIVAFGSSTTDGACSTLNANRLWTDYLALRLSVAGETCFMSVINASISGNTLTAIERPQDEYFAIPQFLFGEPGQVRLAWDACTHTGATDLIVNIGSNDLRLGVTADVLIEAYKQLVQLSRKSLRRIFGTTILPGGYTPEQAEQRRLVNQWLLDEGLQWLDAVFDLATPLRSLENEDILHAEFDSGDGVHPNDEGYRLMAEAIDISKLSGSEKTQD
ncbi:conserved hypothetical protein [Talaromyces stipitatus ATCC 10500]|uniref:SGNH hydrolase-type esterase domain-containing protein n=1 Tax=Talaromyces stipitatus (strain ATCC 10500 / CBS 375.48 / QM 6759 / NRRL 1006) TaxID=441959 RepID=B8LXC2_TALSN|nr:uncharacterized protein TSTA_066500 [Talaromyces stipitatus ATCC 10500]EED23203.1 conserved hypothetical protein [Talaromyces stipitatus ATCC 10500]